MNHPTSPTSNPPTPNELAIEAVTYGFTLYEMARMRAATSPRRCAAGWAGDHPDSRARWCNVFTHARKLVTAGGSRVVSPNNDTLYTNAWLDLQEGPLVIDVPDTSGRYYVLGLLDFYSNPFGSIGQRATGTRAGSFVVTPPGWEGTLPPALQGSHHIQAPTRWIWIIGRTLVDGPDDVGAVHEIQDGFVLRTLAAWMEGRNAGAAPRKFDCGFDSNTIAQAEPEAAMFVEVVNAALRENPAPILEQDMLDGWIDLGIGPDAPAPSQAQLAVIAAALSETLAKLRATTLGKVGSNGWQIMPLLEHDYGNDYEWRALVALKYIGALNSREATYPLAYVDGQGVPLQGLASYRLRFAPDGLPPVDGFWSITMYDATDFMLVPNPINRYAIGDRTSGLHRDAEGGLTLVLQREQPTDPAEFANWLPTPAGRFYVCLRAYAPKAPLLEGAYNLPPIELIGRGD